MPKFVPGLVLAEQFEPAQAVGGRQLRIVTEGERFEHGAAVGIRHLVGVHVVPIVPGAAQSLPPESRPVLAPPPRRRERHPRLRERKLTVRE